MKIVVLLSGGLDSSAAAKLLVDQGEEVVGVTLNLGESRSCELAIARDVCRYLDIPHHVIDLADEFNRQVIRPYHDQLFMGLTPNPCPVCNVKIKLDKGIIIAQELDADRIATGHYARKRKVGSDWQLLEACDLKHSQSYFLALINQRILAKLVFPIGDLGQAEVHRIGKEIGAGFRRSQEICFDPQLNEKKGKIVDKDGVFLGTHKGHYFYTVGQRHGMGIGGGNPFYVVSKSPKENKITVGGRDDLYGDCIEMAAISWVGKEPELPLSGQIRIRYLATPAQGVVKKVGDGYRIILDKAQFAITPGQLAVINQDEVILGAGWIRSRDGCG